MSKKVLSLALAVVMLISVFAFSATAANTTVETTFPGTSQCGFRVVSNAYVGMPAGETVYAKVYYVFPAGTDFTTYLHSITNVVVAYTDAFQYQTDVVNGTTAYEGRTWGESYASYFKVDSGVNNKTTTQNTIMTNISKNTADAAMGWDSAIIVQQGIDTNSGLPTTGAHTVDPYCEVFTLEFVTTRVIEADDSIGVPASSLAKQTAVKYINSSNRAVAYTAANLVADENAKSLVVAGDDTATAKMRPGTEAGTVDLGLTGTVNALSFNAGKEWGAGCYVAPNLSAVGAQARVNGGVSAGESTCIYETADGFNYRAAITGIDAEGLGAQIEVRTYITDVNGNTYFSNWMLIDATTVHANAVGNGMTGII